MAGKPSWNKGKKTGQTPWNKGKTGVYTVESRQKMGAKNKWIHRSVPTEFKKGENTGTKHRLWKGQHAQYTSIHSWVSRWKGRPKYCEMCKRTDKLRYDWANIDGKYSRNLDDYKRFCRSCHVKYDIELKIEQEVQRRLAK